MAQASETVTETESSSTASLTLSKPPAGAEKEIYLKDYAPYPYVIDEVDLEFDLGEEKTIVFSTLKIHAASAEAQASSAGPPLVLNGEELKLLSLYIDSKPLKAGEHYDVTEQTLTVRSPPASPFTLGCVVEIYPHKNTMLEGLYKSSGNFCTQNEAEGFRRITYWPDRPDVMTTFTTKIVAQKSRYPVLLSNGNQVASGDMDGGRHFAIWVDPFPKPCYLFALVAGDLVCHEDFFVTMTKKKVTLRIWTQAYNKGKTDHAMNSLKAAMKWDEERFGLEYDLDLFNIVAVDDFNMGAMENKSLNIFNSRLVLATPQIATDANYEAIEAVVAHEYFHNWTGDRVTCRDWFQLSLKEGLTVFREQEFCSDMHSRAVKRIEDVKLLRSAQFSEDAGPMAHPVRPPSYQKIDNFYTLTVYEKGSEVIRMYHTLLGESGFQKGMQRYFERHDGQAVTTDDFYQAMVDANKTDLGNFKLWYTQAGTPTLKVEYSWHESEQEAVLKCTQELPSTPKSPTDEKSAQLLPVAVGFIGSDGKDLEISEVKDEASGKVHTFGGATTAVIQISEQSQTFRVLGLKSSGRPVPSILRGFSAPIILKLNNTEEDLNFQLKHDSDTFNRWEAAQKISSSLMLGLVSGYSDAAANEGPELPPCELPESFIDAYRSMLLDPKLDRAFVAHILVLPTVEEIVAKVTEANPVAVYKVRESVKRHLSQALHSELSELLSRLRAEAPETYTPDTESVARRSLCSAVLALLCSAAQDDKPLTLAMNYYKEAKNMTDKVAALAALSSKRCAQRNFCFNDFYTTWQNDSLVVLKWLQMQASSELSGNLEAVEALLEHPAFDIKVPNKVYSVLGGFGRNCLNFHAIDGSGYKFLADNLLKVDKINAQVAARMASPFTKWRQYDKARQELMQSELRRMMDQKLSDNLYEIVSKSL